MLEVHWPAEKEQLANRPIRVNNLPEVNNGWKGPGRYILPLVSAGAEYQVATVPRSPGYDRFDARIYEDTPVTREQLKQIRPSE